MKNIQKKIIMKTKNLNKAKIDAKLTLDKSLDKLKNVKFTSGKPEKINKVEFKLSF